MITIKDKLAVLATIAKPINEQHITWAVGASLLLYLKGYVDDFNDIDIMVTAADAEKVKNILNQYGTLQELHNTNFRTKHFYEFDIKGIEIDVIGGMVIVKDNIEYDCDLKKAEISEYRTINEQPIPLHSLRRWREYYALMDRREKVKIIDQQEARAAKEQMISTYFNMWVDRDFTGLSDLFAADIYYSECYGPEYFKMAEITAWIEEMLQKQQVLEWHIKKFIHANNTVVVEWYFKDRQAAGINDFDGVSLIEFQADGKIAAIKEFESKAMHFAPYHHK